MTGGEHARAADDAFRNTTITYQQWQKNVAAGKYPAVGPPSKWGVGFQHLNAITDAMPAPGPAAPGSTGRTVTAVPYTDGIGLNVQGTNLVFADYAIDQGTGDSAVLVGTGQRFAQNIHLSRFRIRKAAIGNNVPYGKHGVYMDCYASVFEDFDIQGSPYCANGFSVRMGNTTIRRATISDCYFPIAIFDSDTGQTNGQVLIEDVVGLFEHDTAVWCDAQDDYKTTFDLHLTFRRCSMTGPGWFLKATRIRNASFRFEQCLLNGRPLTAGSVPADSTIL